MDAASLHAQMFDLERQLSQEATGRKHAESLASERQQQLLEVREHLKQEQIELEKLVRSEREQIAELQAKLTDERKRHALTVERLSDASALSAQRLKRVEELERVVQNLGSTFTRHTQRIEELASIQLQKSPTTTDHVIVSAPVSVAADHRPLEREITRLKEQEQESATRIVKLSTENRSLQTRLAVLEAQATTSSHSPPTPIAPKLENLARMERVYSMQLARLIGGGPHNTTITSIPPELDRFFAELRSTLTLLEDSITQHEDSMHELRVHFATLQEKYRPVWLLVTCHRPHSSGHHASLLSSIASDRSVAQSSSTSTTSSSSFLQARFSLIGDVSGSGDTSLGFR